jgi:hypothetical protein
VYGCEELFIEKKPIIAKIHAINISKKPTRIIVSIAPIHSKFPAVSKECSPILSEQ